MVQLTLDGTNPWFVDSLHKKGRCFAYLYDAKNDECDGYVFDHTSSYTDYEECGVNSAADVTLPDPDSAQPSIVSYSGCSFSSVRLGVVFTKEKCEELCVNCKQLFLSNRILPVCLCLS